MFQTQDKDEFLPTHHGFDEFFGNLYRRNAEEEPDISNKRKAGHRAGDRAVESAARWTFSH